MPPPPPPTAPSTDPAILERNLEAIGRCSPATAQSVRTASAHAGLEWVCADDGRWSASLDGRWLASKRRPWDEAQRFAAGLDPTEAGAAVVTGFGVGHHVEAMCAVMGRGGVVLCYEPDVSLLRAVFERVDCSAWIASCNLAIMTDEHDASAISTVLQGVESVVALGIKVFAHQPSQPRLGQGGSVFCAAFTSVISAMKTSVVTTLMQTETTLRNLLANADWYSSAPGAGDLVGCASGRPAVVVSAGPSLARNLHLLGEDGVRDRVVIIAVQTVLKPMLKAGIKPHFVVAVDYHEISKRFYEGLSASDVEGITLLCDPKANPVICETYPGAVRLLHDGVLHGLLGEHSGHDTASVPPSATVAHLAYTSARLMGCDPVILIGQDLGYSDGVYYGTGAAIHEVWAGELNSFRTLETLEWERIARGRPQSRKLLDVHGKTIYTDEQMHTYLVQFERMFADDLERGLRVIDATEGGVLKAHTEPMRLKQALNVCLEDRDGALNLPTCERDEAGREAAGQRVADHLETVCAQVQEVAQISRRTVETLDEMIDADGDQSLIGPMVEHVHQNGRDVSLLQPGYSLAQYLNQTGTLKRFKADRVLHYQKEGLTSLERQNRQIERDKMNVTWLADACDQLEELLTNAAKGLRTGDKPTTDPRDHAAEIEVLDSSRLAAVIAVDPDVDSLGRPRDLAKAYAGGGNPLRRTLKRIAQSGKVDRVVLIAEDAERVRLIAGAPIEGLKIIVDASPTHPLGDKRSMVASARRAAPACWRGGLGGATVFDEIVSTPALLETMQRHELEAAVVVGCDWAAVDPGLIDACTQRHREHPSRNRMVFTQAAPGLGPIVLGRTLVEELAPHEGRQRLMTSMAGLLGYTPVAPVADPIAKSMCARVDPALRDIPIRCIADASWHSKALGRVLKTDDLDAHGIAQELALGGWVRDSLPLEVTLELCTGRLVGGQAAITRLGRLDPAERTPMALEQAVDLVQELAAISPGAMLTLAGAGDPLVHPQWEAVVEAAIKAGLGVHVRTDLIVEGAVSKLIELGPDVVSVDHYANDAETYAELAGMDYFERVQESTRELISQRDARRPAMWVVPRITRCDEVLDQIESFYDKWLLFAGACVIDRPSKGQADAKGRRVQRMAGPALAQLRRRAWSLRVRCDAMASRPGSTATVDLAACSLSEAWTKLRRSKKARRVAA